MSDWQPYSLAKEKLLHIVADLEPLFPRNTFTIAEPKPGVVAVTLEVSSYASTDRFRVALNDEMKWLDVGLVPGIYSYTDKDIFIWIFNEVKQTNERCHVPMREQ